MKTTFTISTIITIRAIMTTSTIRAFITITTIGAIRAIMTTSTSTTISAVNISISHYFKKK